MAVCGFVGLWLVCWVSWRFLRKHCPYIFFGHVLFMLYVVSVCPNFPGGSDARARWPNELYSPPTALASLPLHKRQVFRTKFLVLNCLHFFTILCVVQNIRNPQYALEPLLPFFQRGQISLHFRCVNWSCETHLNRLSLLCALFILFFARWKH